jgi:uncharacterized cupredoxin-like copper-binding protein
MDVRRRLGTAVLTLVLATGLAACGGDDDEEAADLTAACQAQADTIAGFITMFVTLPEPPEGGPPPPELAGQIRDSFDANLARPLSALQAEAPDEIRDEVDEIALKARQFRDEGNPEAVQDEAFTSLTDTVDAYMQENCSGTKAKVEAINYAYRNLPSTLATGTVRIEMENTATEAHEMVVLNRKPGVTETYDQILALPFEQQETKVDFVNAASADPGKTAYLVATMPAGDYIFLCSFGKGTTDDDDVKDAEPHFTLGMRQEVKVA